MERGLNIDMRRRIIVNGKEYGSVDELPAMLRKAYEEAIRCSSGPAKTRIRLNGQEYDSIEALPPDLRHLYHDALRAAHGEAFGQKATVTSADLLSSGSSISGPLNKALLSSAADQSDSAARFLRTALTYGALAVIILVALYLRYHT